MFILDWSYVCDRKQIAILYSWIDSIPFTRKKTKIERDFSDGGISLLLLSFACFFEILTNMSECYFFQILIHIVLLSFVLSLKKYVLGY
jgi:hypothetical protein